MAYNFLDLTNVVLTAFNEVNLTSSNFDSCKGVQAHAKDCVNDAISDINQEELEWPFNHTSGTQVLDSTTPTQEYSLPADYDMVDWESFRIQPDNTLEENGRHLIWYPWEYYLARYYERDHLHTNVSTGKPEAVFQRVEDKFGVTPFPDKDYTVAFDYYALPTRLDAYDDVPSIPEKYRNVIELCAKRYMHIFRDNFETAAAIKEEYEDALQNMRTILINKRNKRIYDGRRRGRGASWKDPFF